MITRQISFPEGDETKRLLNNVKRLIKNRALENVEANFSSVVREALTFYVDREVRLVQSRINDFKDPLEERLDKLHSRFISPNPERFGTWDQCLEANDLLNEKAFQYSKMKGWRMNWSGAKPFIR